MALRALTRRETLPRPLAEKLAEKLEIPHLSTLGELFRQNIGNGTKLGLEAKRYLDAGDLVPAELTNELVDDRLSDPDTAGAGFILDGYPRSVPQAQALHDMLERRGVQLDAVLEFRVPQDALFERLKARGRGDDTDDVIINRMNIYRDETAPLIEYSGRRAENRRRSRLPGRGVRPRATGPGEVT